MKMSKKWIVLISLLIPLCIILFFTSIFTVRQYVVNRVSKMKNYNVAGNDISSVGKVLGERKVTQFMSKRSNSIVYKQYTYHGMKSAKEDVQKYVKYICKEDTFKIIKYINRDSDSGEISLRKKSFLTGKVIHMMIKYDDNGYMISLKGGLLFKSSHKITTQELKNLLNYGRLNILTIFIDNYEAGNDTETSLYYIFAKDIGISFVFDRHNDNAKPDHLYITNEYNVRNVNFKGAKPGMTFKKIQERAGRRRIHKYITNDGIMNYILDYKEDGLVYRFMSINKDGTNSELHIFEYD